jgi:hypothetical protein
MEILTDATLSNGTKVSEHVARFERLLAIAQVVNPKLAKSMERGIFDPLTDNDAIKVKLMSEIASV